uniref:G-protein coupled receptors family 1 profile domain-containing protein n=1 Tax=Anopheles albimanus TaxID=7167 RepID=A0A182FAY4_ANOAL
MADPEVVRPTTTTRDIGYGDDDDDDDDNGDSGFGVEQQQLPVSARFGGDGAGSEVAGPKDAVAVRRRCIVGVQQRQDAGEKLAPLKRNFRSTKTAFRGVFCSDGGVGGRPAGGGGAVSETTATVLRGVLLFILLAATGTTEAYSSDTHNGTAITPAGGQAGGAIAGGATVTAGYGNRFGRLLLNGTRSFVATASAGGGAGGGGGGGGQPLHQASSIITVPATIVPNERGVDGVDTGLAAAGGTAVSVGYNDSSEIMPQIPEYIRATSMVFCIIIMCLGVIGNIMVPIVILKTKDMRNSTNIFLTNLSIADLLVLLVCTPTVLVEVNSPPEVWVLGEEMCK